MGKKNLLAFDLGASSGRAILGTLQNNRLRLTEIHRFTNQMAKIHGSYYWNIYNLFEELKTGLKKCVSEHGIQPDSIGIDTLINKKLLAANNIFRYIRKGEVVAMTKLNNMNAELLEFVVKPTSNICNELIKEVDFPRSAIIGGVIRNGEGLIALGNFKIQEGDRVVVCCLPKSIKKVEKLFL